MKELPSPQEWEDRRLSMSLVVGGGVVDCVDFSEFNRRSNSHAWLC
jgi:hypothetical protein